MSEVRDPAIKLFGRNIPLTDGQFLSDSLHNSDLDSHTPSISHLMYECEEATKTEVDGRLVEKYCKQNIPSDLDDRKDNCQNSTQENEVKADQKPEEDGVSKGDICGQEKVLKRPTKALPCPRCNSLETKFCYFNNYNVNQPRHFCKNCRRYWTAGGIMRNVPVRAGKHKNKHLSSQCNQVVVPPNVVPVIRGDTIISAGDCSLSRVGLPASSGLVKGMGEVLKFSTNAPLCESMATVLNLKDQKKSGKISSTAAEDDGEEPLSSGSSLVAATSQESELLGKEIEQFALPGHDSSYNPKHTLQCYPLPPWAYPWNPDWNAMVFGLNSGIPNSAHMGSPPMVAVPGFSGPSITFPFIPASKWNAPLVGSTGSASVSSSTSNSSCSGESMSQVRDPAIKHFGRNIPLTDGQFLSDSLHNSDFDCHTPSIPQLMYECEEATKTEVDGPLVEKYCKQNIPSDLDDRKDNNCQNSIQENEVKADQKPEEDGVSKGDIRGQEKVLKKPTKVLPCPRCNSSETKFCYFNNYNVNQPRHFCKNCRRYWTAGGIMRNVPFRVGRCNNKHLSSQCNQVAMPPNVVPVIPADTIISASDCSLSRVGLPSSSGRVQGVGEVLKFSTDAPLCESMATVHLKDHKKSVEIGSTAAEDDGKEPLSSGSSSVAATSQESELLDKEIEQFVLPGHGSSFNPTHTLQCYPVPPWAYPWNPDWNAMVFGLNSGIPNPAHMGSSPMVAVPGFSGPSITFPFIPASYWSCIPSYDPRKWKIPLVGSTGSASVSSSTSNSSCSGNSSPTLGKHSRDTNLQAEETKEQCLWVPKTLRIDDPEEAAKSSIWSTLGIKPDNDKPIIRGGIFKAFQSKSVTSSHTSDADQVLQANPAAFSRSQSFQESTLRDTSGV